MHQDSDNTDHKDGRVFVFDDRLGFDHDVKYQLEATLDYPFEDRTTFAASVDPSVLTAEKKRKLDGSPYILVRKATFSEQRELFANDGEIAVGEGAAGADAAAVAIDGLITRSDVHQALAFFIDIEPEPEDVDSAEEYAALMEQYRDQIEAGKRTLRAYGEQIKAKTLSNMKEVYYSFTNDPRYLDRALWVGVVTSVLTEAWDGVGPWRR